VWKTILAFGLGTLVSGFIVFAVAKGDHNRQVDKLSKQIDAIRDTNEYLSKYNSELVNTNNRLTTTVGELEKRITDDNIFYQRRLGEIGKSLIGISDSLGDATASIREIIDGIEQVKKLVEDL
jgi:archaellum component FlaC